MDLKKKQQKKERAQKMTKVLKSRRTLLQLGAVGAAAMVAGSFLPGTDGRAATEQPGQPSVKQMATRGAQKQLHPVAQGRKARKPATLRSAGTPGEVATKATGDRSLRTKRMAKKAMPKATKVAAADNQTLGTRQTARRAAPKVMRTAKTMKTPAPQ